MFHHSAPNISIIFGYPALPIHHPEDAFLSPVLPSYFSDPDVFRASAEILSRTEQHLGLYLSFVISILLLFKTLRPTKFIGVEYAEKSRKPFHFEKYLCFMVGMTIAPIFSVFALSCVFYRSVVHIVLTVTMGKKYAGLLKGPDVLWALSCNEAKSVVNVLLLVEKPFPCRSSTEPSENIMKFMKKVVSKSLLSSSSPFPKLLYRRGKSILGYHYWLKSEGSKVEDYVRSFQSNRGCQDGISESELQDLIGQNCNNPFPFEDSATWELLVGEKPLLSSEVRRQFPIIFRVHHSVGDGVALLRLLLEGLADHGSYKDQSAKIKQKLWAQGAQSVSEKVPEPEFNKRDISLGICSARIENQLDIDANEEPQVTMNIADSATRFRRRSVPEADSSPIKTVAIRQKKSSLSRLRSSFRFLRHSVVKEAPPISQIVRLNSMESLSKPYSPIKGLGDSHLFTKFPANHCVKKSMNSESDIKCLKNTCVIFPQPHKEEISDDQFSFTKSVIVPVKPCTQVFYLPKNIKERQVELVENTIKQAPLKLDSLYKFHDDIFEKCQTYRKPIITDPIPKNEPTTLGQDVLTNQNSTNLAKRSLSVRDIFIDLAISFIIGAVCTKNSLYFVSNKYFSFATKAVKFSYQIPRILYKQTFGKTDDRLLYGKRLSGKKVVSWAIEKDGIATEDLLKSKITEIRKNIGENVKFSDILMTCVSRSLEKFYRRHGNIEDLPSSVNVVLPARVDYDDLTKGMETTSVYQTSHFKAKVTRLYNSRKAMKPPFKWRNISFNSSSDSEPEEVRQDKAIRVHAAMISPSKMKHKAELENKFTVALLQLPIDSSRSPTRTINEDISHVRRVQTQCRQLRNSPDYTLNYFLLRWIAHLFPTFLLNYFLSGGPCTMVLSNLPGPEDSLYLKGMPIRNIVFWVPNRGLNGLGIGILSYCGRFSMGVMADDALISKKELAHEIIQGIFDEVDRLYNLTIQTSGSCKPNQSNEELNSRNSRCSQEI